MEQPKPVIDYAHFSKRPTFQGISFGEFVRGVSTLVTLGGAITLIMGFNGREDWPTIAFGSIIGLFGLTWFILGHVLIAIDRLHDQKK